MTSRSPLLSHVTHAGYALSPRLARPRLLVGAWLEPRPASRYTGSFAERGWSHAPGGSVCRAAAEAAAQSELGQCPDLRMKRKATTVPRRSRYTGLFGAWREPRPQGARCVELRLKPQLGVAARSELASPTSSCLPTGRGRRCRSWRSCRLPRRLVPPVPPEPLAARPLVGLASVRRISKRLRHSVPLCVKVLKKSSLPARSLTLVGA